MIARWNCSTDVNVVREGSPSLILSVRLISLGITICPRSSTRLTIPVAFIVYLSPFTIHLTGGQCVQCSNIVHKCVKTWYTLIARPTQKGTAKSSTFFMYNRLNQGQALDIFMIPVVVKQAGGGTAQRHILCQFLQNRCRLQALQIEIRQSLCAHKCAQNSTG